jgi:DNA-binding NarL/FixJ family response regulator
VTPATRESVQPRPVTDRQLEILVNVARGKTNREIGVTLGISERTVRNHMRSILQRLSSSDRTHAVVLAIGHGWIAVPIEPETNGVAPELKAQPAATGA